jgi:hypothetical protein
VQVTLQLTVSKVSTSHPYKHTVINLHTHALCVCVCERERQTEKPNCPNYKVIVCITFTSLFMDIHVSPNNAYTLCSLSIKLQPSTNCKSNLIYCIHIPLVQSLHAGYRVVLAMTELPCDFLLGSKSMTELYCR